jgi:hypothetical protein
MLYAPPAGLGRGGRRSVLGVSAFVGMSSGAASGIGIATVLSSPGGVSRAPGIASIAGMSCVLRTIPTRAFTRSAPGHPHLASGHVEITPIPSARRTVISAPHPGQTMTSRRIRIPPLSWGSLPSASVLHAELAVVRYRPLLL